MVVVVVVVIVATAMGMTMILLQKAGVEEEEGAEEGAEE